MRIPSDPTANKNHKTVPTISKTNMIERHGPLAEFTGKIAFSECDVYSKNTGRCYKQDYSKACLLTFLFVLTAFCFKWFKQIVKHNL